MQLFRARYFLGVVVCCLLVLEPVVSQNARMNNVYSDKKRHAVFDKKLFASASSLLHVMRSGVVNKSTERQDRLLNVNRGSAVLALSGNRLSNSVRAISRVLWIDLLSNVASPDPCQAYCSTMIMLNSWDLPPLPIVCL